MVADWERENGSPPQLADLPALQQQVASTAAREGVPDSIFALDMLQQWLAGGAGELAPVNAVRTTTRET